MWISRVNNFLLGKIPCSCPLWPPRRVAVEERRGGGVAEQWRRLPDDGVVQRWQGRGAVTASGDDEPVALPVAFSPPLSIGLGYLRWGTVAAANLITRAVSPHLLFIGCATGAHQPCLGLGPRSGREVKGPVGPTANWWRSIPSFSPLISSYTFIFTSFTSFHISSQINA